MKKYLLLVLTSLILNLVVCGQGAYITSVLINSCNGSCSEGDNEIIFGNTGSGTLLATPANITITYGSSASPTTTYTDAFTNNAATTANLNAAAGCSLFIDAAGTTIPAGASFIVVRNTICTNALVWSGLCGNAPVYIIYSTDGSWATGGNFSNGTGTTRYFRSVITTSTGTNALNYDYTLPGAYGNDGAFANWAATGGSAILYGDNDCAITPVSLPLTMISFSKEERDDATIFYWLVEDDRDIAHYEVQYSLDGYNFLSLGEVLSDQVQTQTTYSFSTPQNFSQTWYVRLAAADFNNQTEYFPEILLMKPSNELGFHYNAGIFYNLENENCLLSNISGTIQFQVERHSQIPLEAGLWIVSYPTKVYKCLAY